jgi:DNA-binding NtrC family response regulator
VAPILLKTWANKDMAMQSEITAGTILVVDDDEGVRKLLARWITALGYAVKAAPDAETAVELMRMPGHDGIWLLEQVRRFYPGIAVVLATGLMEMDPMVTLRPGVAGYIVKPFSREDLETVVARGMAERKRLQAEHSSSGPRLLSAGMFDGVVLSRE